MPTPRSLLERYVRAKDSVQPELMREIYSASQFQKRKRHYVELMKRKVAV